MLWIRKETQEKIRTLKTEGCGTRLPAQNHVDVRDLRPNRKYSSTHTYKKAQTSAMSHHGYGRSKCNNKRTNGA